MRLKLFLIVLLAAVLPGLAQSSKIVGTVVNASTGAPISGATVSLSKQGNATTDANGNFVLRVTAGTSDRMLVAYDGYETYGADITVASATTEVGTIRLNPINYDAEMYGDLNDIYADESAMDAGDDDDSGRQNIVALTGANDDIFYNTASYNFGPMYFNYRGMRSEYQTVYLNGIEMNDPIRGRFNFSSLLGLTSRAFRNKTSAVGTAVANYGMGGLGGSVNYNTITDTYAPGFNGSLAFTNSNYMFRAMATYSTGLSKNGWAFTISGIGRYSKEGVIDGTFYNSGGLFLSLEKVLDKHNSLTLTAFGGPTQRATASATYQEVYDLVDDNLYNPNWGWQNGEKRSARIIESYDPTAMLTWLYKDGRTTLNTTAAVRWTYYSQSALQYYKANDPNPTYYRYLPSYYDNQEEPTTTPTCGKTIRASAKSTGRTSTPSISSTTSKTKAKTKPTTKARPISWKTA